MLQGFCLHAYRGCFIAPCYRPGAVTRDGIADTLQYSNRKDLGFEGVLPPVVGVYGLNQLSLCSDPIRQLDARCSD